MAYHQLEQLHRLHDGYMQTFKVQHLNLLLIQDQGRVYLIENRCPHMDVPLATGDLIGGNRIRCRSHGIEFNLDSGRAGGALSDALDCLKKFPLAYQGSTVGIDV